jgi:hypothetical protein
MFAGLPAATHFGVMMRDAFVKSGSGISRGPTPYDGHEGALVQSFFVVWLVEVLVPASVSWHWRSR